MVRQYRRFDEDFKAGAVGLVFETGKPIAQVARELELHGGRSLLGVTTRIAQRLLALTAAIWHNRATGQPITRSLITYDH